LRILDRYLIREVVLPSLIALLVLTFVLEIPPILREGEQLIAKGVELATVAHVLLTLLPQALGLTIPMAVLLGLLIGFGRLSADREFVALQACGISLARLLRPVALIAIVGTVATAHEMIVALPNANQSFREITVGLVATRAEANIKPHVFFEEFPNRVVYVRESIPGGGWRDVFLADSARADQTDIYVAREGRLVVDRARQTVQLHLKDGTRHTINLKNPDEYQGTEFGTIVLTVDPASVFPRPPAKGVPEKTITELGADIARAEAEGLPTHSERFMIQLKFALPVACPVLALIALALGASNRKDGKLASFVIGVLVIFAYYVLLYGARALANSGKFSAAWAPWVPNIVLGAAGPLLMMLRVRAADQPIRIGLPAFLQRLKRADASAAEVERPVRAPRPVLVVRLPHLRIPRPRLLDLYVARQYLQVFFLGIVSLLGVFYISTFIDLADKLFRGSATTSLLLRYFFYATPQFAYYVIPMSALVAALVTVGVMTKNSELIVMRACGISLYRAAVPLVLFAIVASLVLFGLQERVLAYSNREADRLNAIIRHYPVHTFSAANRRWMVGTGGDIYHYDLFDPRGNRFARFSIYHLDPAQWRLGSVSYAAEVRRTSVPDAANADPWLGTQGWVREFGAAGSRGAMKYSPFAQEMLPLEEPGYFKTEDVESEHMTYGQLRNYITQLRTSGFNAVPQMVELQRKVAFPLVTLVMTLIAVPFAVTTGRRGALYGIGVGIVLAIVYWITLSVFAAMGAGGLITPILAAWAPNILFGAAAVYLILTVRT
jgi:LPS export ABC transporter permease LptG/LPS export ABC transporter permease LptF